MHLARIWLALHGFAWIGIIRRAFRGSSAVEQWTVNPLVVGSNPTLGAMKNDQLLNWSFSIL